MKDLKKELIKLSDPDYKKFNEKLCPDTNRKILGIRIPKLRKFAKNIIKENDWKEVLKDIDNEYFEEIILQGFIIGYAKCDIEEKLIYIKDFVPKIDSWAISDTFVPTLKIKEKDLNIVWDFLTQYFSSKREFEVRFAIIMLLDYYIKDEYVNKVIEILDNINHNGYYVKMGVAWCLAEIRNKIS